MFAPIRLYGQIDAIDLATGETARAYDTAREPGGVLHVACGNRRESVCPACSQVYKRDAHQLVRAGLVGKGVQGGAFYGDYPGWPGQRTRPRTGWPPHSTSRRRRGADIVWS